MSGLVMPFPNRFASKPPVAFDRLELGRILDLYGRMVAAGEWRDYAMSFLREVAVFSIFRRAAETPIYRIEKRPRLRGAAWGETPCRGARRHRQERLRGLLARLRGS